MSTRQRNLLIPYLVIVSLLSALFITAGKLAGINGQAFAGLYMFTPALAAILTYFVKDRSRFKHSGLRFGRFSFYARAYGLALLLTIMQFLGYTLAGAIDWDFSGNAFIAQLSQQLTATGQDINAALPAGMPVSTMLWLLALAGLTVFNIVPGLISGLGEEYGWRGLMAPALSGIGTWPGLVLGGTIWFAWHLPLMLLMPAQPATAFQWVVNILASWLGSIATHTILCYAFADSRSIFVPAFMHATLNNAARAFAYFALINNQPVANVITACVMIIVAFLLARRHGLNALQQLWSEPDASLRS